MISKQLVLDCVGHVTAIPYDSNSTLYGLFTVAASVSIIYKVYLFSNRVCPHNMHAAQIGISVSRRSSTMLLSELLAVHAGEFCSRQIKVFLARLGVGVQCLVEVSWGVSS